MYRDDWQQQHLRPSLSLGFTGTRLGMTDEQQTAFRALVSALRPTEFHHGDCVGADSEAHVIIRRYMKDQDLINLPWVHIHPPVDDAHRGWNVADTMHKPLTHFARNRKIVLACDVLVGASAGEERSTKGGTWYTIDYARKLKKRVVVLWPDGTTEESP